MVLPPRCSYKGNCPIHKNECSPRTPEFVATCFKCGADIKSGDIRCLGSQGNSVHPEWILVYCPTCMNPLDDSMKEWDRNYKERLAGFPNTPPADWNGYGI